ncbi:MAG: putative acetyltransferase [Hydrocarboniphaga sp.]|uniref:GNAT family N-acetyltransferase n=1 Tax=Hydrocarboniphaga sp. TaxID=2033016 RepID=UPI002620ED7B|nr:GNAT family N-acetyltransferase [Hydrocarboniphaga sp.]MDB5969821.1 putative acetyltransferase [Hydrocarboniphaga sp.]
MDADFEFKPLKLAQLGDAESVFGDCGDGRHCWCSYWYRSQHDYKAGWGEGNHQFFRKLLHSGATPGLLAYRGTAPAGWCGLAPRHHFDRLNRSRSFAPVDSTPVWALNCFIVKKDFRRQGLLKKMIAAAVKFAGDHGAECVEAYPVDALRKHNSAELYVGTLSAFEQTGFVEVARRLPSRPIVRLRLK